MGRLQLTGKLTHLPKPATQLLTIRKAAGTRMVKCQNQPKHLTLLSVTKRMSHETTPIQGQETCGGQKYNPINLSLKTLQEAITSITIFRATHNFIEFNRDSICFMAGFEQLSIK
uniref:Uncharacterized protein n=1 Tax=Opuntia streptacantha TaxID=393608 RepID=A0A7C9D421_OPUST